MADKVERDVDRWRRHLAAERDAIALYRGLADADKDVARGRILQSLASVEERHAGRWIQKLRAAGENVSDEWRPGWRPRALGLLARVVGPHAVLPIVTALERGDAAMYVGDPDGQDLVREEEDLERVVSAMSAGRAFDGTSSALPEFGGMVQTADAEVTPTPPRAPVGAAPSREPVGAAPVVALGAQPPPRHAHVPRRPVDANVMGREAWHKQAGSNSGTLRAAIFGINDGLVSNTSLVMGVAGADVGNGYVLLAGVAGLLAGAFSMAAGEYVSMQSQRELFERQIALEREELAESPDDEREELSLIYQAKGVPTADADRLASSLMQDTDVALDTLVREELGLDPDELGSPWGAAASSFAAFSVGAVIPVVPYLLFGGLTAFFVSIALVALALFAVGAGVSLLTGRGVLFSGARMVLIGALAAGVTYLVGKLIGVSIAG